MNSSLQVLGLTALCVVAMMVSLWIVSLIKKDASIVDIFWGLGFVMVGWTAWKISDADSQRGTVLAVLTTLWGVRLGGYLWWRNHGKGEDFRYQAMRKHYGSKFALKSLFIVFGLQGALMWVVSLPVQLGQMTNNANIGVVGVIGIVVWATGFLFESVGDIQLARFKANSANAGKVMDKGLWKFTRHPNYFGDACVWWGIALIAAESCVGLFGIIGALVMNILLLKYSGVPILEKSINKRRPGYEEYQRRTSSFIPRMPKK